LIMFTVTTSALTAKGIPVTSKIPLGAKILAVADAFDAMTTDRPYQKGKPPEIALSILEKHAGTKWDKKCVSAFDTVINGQGALTP